ncbi:MAG: response regulator transcription factor [Phycisphaerales bacterium]|nr:response regulator transcription factor [Phycisphaerales bacterium]
MGNTSVTTRPSSVLLVDDHPIVRRGMREIIARELDLTVCGEAGTVEEALRLIEETKPDLVIVDLSLDDVSGLELIKQVAAKGGSTKMLVASMHDETTYADRALQAGALGYINKAEATDHLIGAIRKVLNGKVYLSEEMTARVLDRTRVGGNGGESPIESLTDRELEVFSMFGQGYTAKEIAERLSRSVKTIETHRDNIRAKLDIDTSAELIHRATLWYNENRT